jgi:hypothetical protein
VGLCGLGEGPGQRLLDEILGVEGIAGQTAAVGVQVGAKWLEAVEELLARLPRGS